MLSGEAEPCETPSLIKVSYTNFKSSQKRQPKIMKEIRYSPVVYEPVDIREVPACCPGSNKTHLHWQQQWKEPSARPFHHSFCSHITLWKRALLLLFFLWDPLPDFYPYFWNLINLLIDISNCKASYHKNAYKCKTTGPWFFFPPLSHEFRTQTAIRKTFFFPNKTISFPQWKKISTKSSWSRLSLL